MKKSNLIMGLLSLGLMSTAAMAGDFYKDIYDALNVEVVRITPAHVLGAVTYQKSIGGLVCRMNEVVLEHSRFTYSCALYDEGRDNEAIYNALDVEPRNTTPHGIMGHQTSLKEVGLLSCSEWHNVVPNPVSHYNCFLQAIPALNQ